MNTDFFPSNPIWNFRFLTEEDVQAALELVPNYGIEVEPVRPFHYIIYLRCFCSTEIACRRADQSAKLLYETTQNQEKTTLRRNCLQTSVSLNQQKTQTNIGLWADAVWADRLLKKWMIWTRPVMRDLTRNRSWLFLRRSKTRMKL